MPRKFVRFKRELLLVIQETFFDGSIYCLKLVLHFVR